VKTPIALTIAGSDPSGGAGIQADLKTFSALGVYGASVITALTAQNTRGVTGVLAIPPGFITGQIDTLAADLRVTAAKTGMLGDDATVIAVADGILRHSIGPLVVDPVMVATSGDPLLAPSAIAAVKSRLVPFATLVTPNLHEAARLLDRPPAESLDDMERQARDLLALGAAAVLVKGGHHTGADAVDVLAMRGSEGVRRFAAPRIATRNTHGTGCTLSAAITARLALGEPLERAITFAKDYVTGALAAGRELNIGHGCGPVDHLFRLRRSSTTS
jgi:hydroxymethylpyrimidine/phosphomethylpyrimidine kinase